MAKLHDSQPPSPDGEVLVYEAASHSDVSLEVRLERETLWLTQRQMADLFRTTTSNVSRHLRNVFADGELDPSSTIKDIAVVRSEGDRRVRRKLAHYDLDAVISVGYRVDSKRAVRFRQWADRVMRRLWLITSIKEAVQDVAGRYVQTWRYLLQYDEDRLDAAPPGVRPASATLDPGQAEAAITHLKEVLIARGEASPLFGVPRGRALEEVLANARQTGDGLSRQSREERAAILLARVVMDRPFEEGNNRIGPLLFLVYLRQEGLRHDLNPQALTALTLLVAQNAPANRDLLVRLIVNLLAEPSRGALIRR